MRLIHCNYCEFNKNEVFNKCQDRPKSRPVRLWALAREKLGYPIDNIKGGDTYEFSGVIGNQRNS